MDYQAMELDQLVVLAQRQVESTGQTIAIRRTTTVPLDPPVSEMEFIHINT